jgi:hypothetical protein
MPKIKLRNRWMVYFAPREQLLGYVEALSEDQAVELAIKK